MSNRRAFLLRLFALMDERSIPFVVLRNYEHVFDSDTSDVDLLAMDVAGTFMAACDAASSSGLRLVQRTRFVNHSWVWWDGRREFIRLDVDTALRWRWLEVCDTRSVLRERSRHCEFWIPTAKNEATTLGAHIIARGFVEERYAKRLEWLGAPPCDPAIERRKLAVAHLLNPLRWPRVIRHVLSDTRRYFFRRRNPAGITVHVATATEFDSDGFRNALRNLFPLAKQANGSANERSRTRFTGGLSLTVQRVQFAKQLPAAIRGSGADFQAMIEPTGRLHIADAAGGGMFSAESDKPSDDLAQFICVSLARRHARASRKRGVSVMLAGVDGAGKTTFARNLCATADQVGFAGCRYFHWIPRVFGKAQFPWPVFSDLARNFGPASALLSVFRLLKSILLARISWTFRIAPLVRAGHLVLLDRFITNYWLDPASVRYGGPAWLLALAQRLFPKPDVLIALDAPEEILSQRKGELTPGQIREQQQRLRDLPSLAKSRIDLDAAQPPDALAATAFAKLSALP